MSTIPHVLHRTAKPIGSLEFLEALQETCKPRFPWARPTQPRAVAIAVSGGVDSMALAFLCARFRRYNPEMRVCDNTVTSFRAMVVDHGLRPESSTEAKAVSSAVRTLGVSTECISINWKRDFPNVGDPLALPNMESLARRGRYRKLGGTCANRSIVSLLLAHHQDDQYETVLMRLLQGHNSRGLRGMRPAAAIPECESMFGAYNSGFVDNKGKHYSSQVTKQQIRYLREDLRMSIARQMDEEGGYENAFSDDGLLPDWATDSEEFDYLSMERMQALGASYRLGVFPVEDGGVNIYRPLLQFGKDRLIATCEANNVPWFEDRTNNDRTLTMRNAVRYMYKNFELPKALQKPAVLELSRTANRFAESQDAEADRLLQRTIIHDLQPQVGTMVVQFPELPPIESRRCRRGSQQWRQRLRHKRTVAALLVQRIIDLVTPDLQLPTPANLHNVVQRLFPALQGLPPARTAASPAAKAFPIAGLHFMPIDSTPPSVSRSTPAHPRTWYIARLPYSRDQPLPIERTAYWSDVHNWASPKRRWAKVWKWSSWMKWFLFDGRFWIRLTHRLPYRVVVMPFMADHAKPFRESLDPKMRVRLHNALKK
jgi:tRNA(Ile)-lysidine synthase